MTTNKGKMGLEHLHPTSDNPCGSTGGEHTALSLATITH